MRSTVRYVRSSDDVIEVSVAIHHRVIVSRINYTHLARVRQTLSAIERIRGDAIRLGLFELALAPESVARNFLSEAAVAGVDRGASAAQRCSVTAGNRIAAEPSLARFA
jgi:hypothetical protein